MFRRDPAASVSKASLPNAPIQGWISGLIGINHAEQAYTAASRRIRWVWEADEKVSLCHSSSASEQSRR